MTHHPLRVFSQSQCHQCQGVRYTQSKSGSLFLMCQLTQRRYPPQPVSICSSKQPHSLIRLTIKDHAPQDTVFQLCSPLNHEQVSMFSELKEELTWGRRLDNQADNISFEPMNQDLIAHFFALNINDSSPKLSPSGCFSLSSSMNLNWHLNSGRYTSPLWLDTMGGQRVIDACHQAIKSAHLITLSL